MPRTKHLRPGHKEELSPAPAQKQNPGVVEEEIGGQEADARATSIHPFAARTTEKQEYTIAERTEGRGPESTVNELASLSVKASAGGGQASAAKFQKRKDCGVQSVQYLEAAPSQKETLPENIEAEAFEAFALAAAASAPPAPRHNRKS